MRQWSLEGTGQPATDGAAAAVASSLQGLLSGLLNVTWTGVRADSVEPDRQLLTPDQLAQMLPVAPSTIKIDIHQHYNSFYVQQSGSRLFASLGWVLAVVALLLLVAGLWRGLFARRGPLVTLATAPLHRQNSSPFPPKPPPRALTPQEKERFSTALASYSQELDHEAMFRRLATQFRRRLPAERRSEGPEAPAETVFETGKLRNTFTRVEQIGGGGFGVVYKALHKFEGKWYALKRIPLRVKEGQDIKQTNFYREVVAMMNLNHANVVRYITSWVEEAWTAGDGTPLPDDSYFDLSLSSSRAPRSSPTPETPEGSRRLELVIQMEFCAGPNLHSYLQSAAVSNAEAFLIFSQITDGLAYLHARGLIHRDLKPSNVFISSEGVIKIGDFGLATIGPADEGVSEAMAGLAQAVRATRSHADLFSKKIGTPLYCSPEQLSSTRYTQSTDVYALGVVLYELVSCFATEHQRVSEVGKLRRTGPSLAFATQHPAEAELVREMTAAPGRRPSSLQLKSLPAYLAWRRGVSSQVRRVLDGEETPSAHEEEKP